MLRNLKEFSPPALEEKVLAYWRANHVFEASLKKTEKGKRFVFYEGPPTANGRPGIHHVLARAFKDIVLRYRTMRGFHVPRRGGWDTHGLPVEIEVEKALGLTSKKDIEKFGIAAFNARCKESVWKYKDEWEKLTERMGFWLDMKHPYITYENRYMEAVWGILKEVWKKKLLYRGHKVVPWCPRCGTGLSSHELALGYETVEDTSVYVKFQITNSKSQINSKLPFPKNKPTYILSWTTTPWTLPGNVALAVGPDITYSVVRVGTEHYLLASERLNNFQFSNSNFQSGSNDQNIKLEVIKEVKGKDLVGLEYEPLFEIEKLKSNKSYRIYPADFVTTEDGTGVVHTAVMYGEDDYRLGMKVGLPGHHTVDEAGKFTRDVKGFAGLSVKAPETERKLLEYLRNKNRLLKIEPYLHEYPFCWRCKTPLLYYARDSWFIAMSKLRAKLIAENKRINWIPAHLREGRFGEWLREVKDWAISRSRYWGTPLPIWECGTCGEVKVIGSLKELDVSDAKPTTVILMRHGEALHNVKGLANPVSSINDRKTVLTERGEASVRAAAEQLKSKGIDVIVASPSFRAQQTAKIVARALGIKRIETVNDLRDINVGKFELRPIEEFRSQFKNLAERFEKKPDGAENLREVRARVMSAMAKIRTKYEGKTILVVTHGDPLWMLTRALEGVEERNYETGGYLKAGEWKEMKLHRWPYNEQGELDLHRPYVDAVTFPCSQCKKGTMRRVPEVLDVWFDSGAMPFAANETFTAQTRNSKLKIRNLENYPADYISEGLDQTRGWFYTLHAIGVLMGRGRAYKNVISLGLILDKNGQKMSKSKGNTVDPWVMIEKYGIDAVRWYFYTVNPPGESKRFNEADIEKTLRQFLMLIYNSYLFYETYALKSPNGKIQMPNASHILDKWILARWEETKNIATKSLDKYEVGDAARAIEAFAGDLSRWYIRRSRRRLQKPESTKDHEAASATLGYVLLGLAKLMAPFAPFFAEALYLSLVPQEKGKVTSVHVEDWPKGGPLGAGEKKLLAEMEEVRRLASMGLAVRAERGIKVRQPLSAMTVKSTLLKGKRELLAILADEVNVKRVHVETGAGETVVLDTNITHELLEEGWFRELVRTVQGMRQDAKLTPRDTIVVYAELPEELTHVIRARETELKREVNAKAIELIRTHKHVVELQTRIGDWPVWLAVKKI